MLQKYVDLTEKIIGASLKIHTYLGNGFLEVVYQRCLAIELQKLGLHYEREQTMHIYYDGQHVGSHRIDFLVENKVIVELKATPFLEPAHSAQLLRYLKTMNREVGLLINFGERSLLTKRIVN